MENKIGTKKTNIMWLSIISMIIIGGCLICGGVYYYINNNNSKAKDGTNENNKSESYIVILDANEGNISTSQINVTKGEAYGALPIPIRDDYEFEGWFTEKNGGAEIMATTIVEVSSNQTLYARWVNKSSTIYGTFMYEEKEKDINESVVTSYTRLTLNKDMTAVLKRGVEEWNQEDIYSGTFKIESNKIIFHCTEIIIAYGDGLPISHNEIMTFNIVNNNQLTIEEWPFTEDIHTLKK